MTVKPCPFCGGEPHFFENDGWFYVECGNVTCATICETRGSETKEEAAKDWNTRAEEPAEKTAHWDIACGDYTPFCSACGEEPPACHMSAYCPNCGAKMITRRHEE